MTSNSPHTTNEYAILFVDDEEKARKMFSRLVSPYFTVLTAEDVREAKEVLEQKHDEIGVLITDQRMPGELGVDLLRHIRKEYPKIIRMLTTAYTDLDDAIEAVNTGEIFRYINKPWNADELLIDLRLAMNFFEIEQDRLQLIQEKMSVSHRQSRMEALKNLISMGSAQQGFCCPKLGIKSFLVQTVDAQKVVEESMEVNSGGYWEGEVSKTEKMIRINSGLNEGSDKLLSLLSLVDGGSVDFLTSVNHANDALSISAHLEMASSVDQAVLGQEGVDELLLVVLQTFSTNDIKVVISESESEDNVVVQCSVSSPNDNFVRQLVMIDDSSGASSGASSGNSLGDKYIGQLIATFLMVSHIGGSFKLSFDGSKLATIELVLPQNAYDQKGGDIQDNIWIEDLFVLYS